MIAAPCSLYGDSSHHKMECMSVYTTEKAGTENVLTGLSDDVAGVVLGGFLGLAHEYKLARVCRRWAEFLRSPEYTTHITLAVSDWTFNTLLCDVVREYEDDNNDRRTEDPVSCRTMTAFVERVAGHRGPILLQTNFLRPGRSSTDIGQWMAYVHVVFSVLDNIKNIAAFSMHDSSLATDVQDFLDNDRDSENGEFEQPRDRSYSSDITTVDSWCDARSVLSSGLAKRIRGIVAASCLRLDRLSLRGTLLEHALSPAPPNKIVLQSARYICVPTCVLDWVVCPSIQCFHNLKNSNFTSVFRFLRYHSRLLKCVTLNLHSTRGHIVDETTYKEALDAGFAFDVLSPPADTYRTYRVYDNEFTPQCSLHHTSSSVDPLCTKNEENQCAAVDPTSTENCCVTRYSSPDVVEVNLEDLSSIHVQSTQRGLSLRILDLLRCPRLRHVKIATVGEASSVEGSLRMRESFDRVLKFLSLNGSRVESLHLSLRSFGKIMASTSESFSLNFPRLRSANVSTEFFYHFLSRPDAAPQLSALSLNGFPAAARARRPSSAFFSQGPDAPIVADNSSVVALLNARSTLKTLVLEPHCAEYSDLQYTQHLKISGWTNHGRLVQFKCLPALQTFTSTCAIPWRYLVDVLGAAKNVHSVFVFGGIFSIDFDNQQNEILMAHTSWQYFAGTFAEETALFLKKIGFREVHSHVGICENLFRVFRRDSTADKQADRCFMEERAERLHGEQNVTGKKADESASVVAEVCLDDVLKEVSSQLLHVVPQWLLLCDSILGFENAPRSLGLMLENLAA